MLPKITPIRFALLGGFLGAGKTTVLLRLARHYVAARKRIGIIPNDQRQHPIDTETFPAPWRPVEAVRVGCFCCLLPEPTAAAGRLADRRQPDVSALAAT